MLSLVYSQTCNRAPFPKIVGGTNGLTQFKGTDYHASTNQLVVGGQTADSGLIGFSTTNTVGFGVLWRGPSMEFAWARCLTISTYGSIRQT